MLKNISSLLSLSLPSTTTLTPFVPAGAISCTSSALYLCGNTNSIRDCLASRAASPPAPASSAEPHNVEWSPELHRLSAPGITLERTQQCLRVAAPYAPYNAFELTTLGLLELRRHSAPGSCSIPSKPFRGLITPPDNPCGVHMDSRTPWIFHGFHGLFFGSRCTQIQFDQSMDNPHITMIFIIFMESTWIVHGLHMD